MNNPDPITIVLPRDDGATLWKGFVLGVICASAGWLFGTVVYHETHPRPNPWREALARMEAKRLADDPQNTVVWRPDANGKLVRQPIDTGASGMLRPMEPQFPCLCK